MRDDFFKVGELAKRTGLTVRTLHHYDEIGLLKPSAQTASGHRLYGPEEVARLQAVLSLRQLGFPLQEIRVWLERDDFKPLEAVRLHADRLREQIDLQQKLCVRLDSLAQYLEAADKEDEQVPVERILSVIEEMNMIENYYTPEQLETLKKRKEELGEDAIKAAEQEWPQLMAAMEAEMKAGADPADAKVQALARRWRELVNAFTGGDAGIRQSLGNLWKEQGDSLKQQHNMNFDPKLFEYVAKAHAAAGETC